MKVRRLCSLGLVSSSTSYFNDCAPRTRGCLLSTVSGYKGVTAASLFSHIYSTRKDQCYTSLRFTRGLVSEQSLFNSLTCHSPARVCYQR
ncbi:hypothetical protein BR93DRAFT_724465 [Coniochaeta sp. PMI_546]|nr:hypothetical protein BR93DRAFT_724465 [Coniochaeta sp. PMI_546]